MLRKVSWSSLLCAGEWGEVGVSMGHLPDHEWCPNSLVLHRQFRGGGLLPLRYVVFLTNPVYPPQLWAWSGRSAVHAAELLAFNRKYWRCGFHTKWNGLCSISTIVWSFESNFGHNNSLNANVSSHIQPSTFRLCCPRSGIHAVILCSVSCSERSRGKDALSSPLFFCFGKLKPSVDAVVR